MSTPWCRISLIRSFSFIGTSMIPFTGGLLPLENLTRVTRPGSSANSAWTNHSSVLWQLSTSPSSPGLRRRRVRWQRAWRSPAEAPSSGRGGWRSGMRRGRRCQSASSWRRGSACPRWRRCRRSRPRSSTPSPRPTARSWAARTRAPWRGALDGPVK